MRAVWSVCLGCFVSPLPLVEELDNLEGIIITLQSIFFHLALISNTEVMFSAWKHVIVQAQNLTLEQLYEF